MKSDHSTINIQSFVKMWKKEAKLKSKKNSNDQQGKSSLSGQKGAEHTQAVQEKRRREKLKKTRLEKMEMEDKKIEDVKRRIIANMDKMSFSGEITDSNVEEYYKQVNEGVSQKEIEDALKIKADRLVPLWWKTIEEMQKLQPIFKAKVKAYTVEEVPLLTVEVAKRFGYEAGLVQSITTFISGVGVSLANLEGEDPDRWGLAIVSSSARQEQLVFYLDSVSRLGHDLDLEPLRELSRKLREVLGVIPNF